MRFVHKVAAWLIVLAGCGGDSPEHPAASQGAGRPSAPTLLDAPLSELPPLLSQVGLYVDPADRSAVDPRAIAFLPRWELWSNGLDKARYIVLPAGGAVDTSDRAVWSFPRGTLLFKTFSAGAGPVETRLIRRGEEEWEYAVYLWSADGADAALADPAATHPVVVTVGDESFEHVVPARLDCRKCHESNATVVIGFDELRLNSARPGAAETQLAELAGRGVLSAPPPADPAAVAEPDQPTREVVGYLHGNCAHCHNGGVGAATSFDMRYPVALENIVGVPTDSSASAAGLRISPGHPAESILFQAISGETQNPEVKAMPPVGVQRRDKDAIELLRAWIGALPAPEGR